MLVSTLSFLLVLFLASCTSLQNENLLKSFEEAKSLNIKGDVASSQKIFSKLCEQKHKTSCLLAGKKVNWYPSYAIMQASTDAKSTQFVILHRKSDTPQFFIFHSKTQKIIEAKNKVQYSRGHSDWVSTHLGFTGLIEGDDYQLVVMADRGELADYRSFQTLSLKASPLKWALASCMADHYETEQKQQWLELSSFKPQVLFMIGDNVYVDWAYKKATAQTIWKRYVETRNKLEIFRQNSLVPVFATWDDHDYGMNGGDETFPYKVESQKIFNQFFPMTQNEVVVSRGPGISSAVKLRDQLFLFLDNRSFRTPEVVVEQAHFGKEQVEWLLSEIKKHNLPTWIISGDQFFGGYHPFESFEANHAKAFKNFLRQLKKLKEKVIFVSGDRHLSEIINIPNEYLGYKTFEITSSGIHSTTYPGALKKHPNPRSLVGIDGIINYMILESHANQGSISVDVKDYGPGKQLLFEKKLEVK